jgi:hypothetical protein
MLPAHTPEPLRVLLAAMLSKDPAGRPSAARVAADLIGIQEAL